MAAPSLFRYINMATVMSFRKTTGSPTKRGLCKYNANTMEQKNRLESQKQSSLQPYCKVILHAKRNYAIKKKANCANRNTAHVYFNTYQPANLDDTTSDGCLRMSSTLPQVPTRQLF
ncbi:uncharacterized protein LOC141893018 isoform X1 [Acropora palmata]|uniref:uncharacterized protein LOC141893018 isoform X1 n=2 Tax=Acropora palmata TaxID=6131 RepID=UPI003DA02F37